MPPKLSDNGAIVPPDILGVERSGAGETYIITADGEKLIAASRRADGSIRKPIKVRPGFMPLEEQHRFKSQGVKVREAAEAARRTVVSLSLNDEAVLPKVYPQVQEAAQKKKKKKVAPTVVPTIVIEEPTFPASDSALKEKVKGAEGLPVKAPRAFDKASINDIDEAKQRLKFMKKKVTEAKQLLIRRENGQSLLQNQEQKIDRLPEMVVEITELERMVKEMSLTE